MGLNEELHQAEFDKINEAIEATGGNISKAAERLEIPVSNLRYIMETRHPELVDVAYELREKRGNTVGRPRSQKHSKSAVSKAWNKSKGSVAICARVLKIPESTCRDLLIRNGHLET